eukprot:CAMPEP_0172301528 /NCGR_PEP_ID=MMETSP1058-20130122/3396_1 /TAXON_ID=83371 /ORGANISM="Detonula confervacea, Strain CCMP 353" /LENGTH=97 /DNA_ID=CAMNT_0013011671 /DNA_START=32 /DNA_END=326 /DNA_ORIENTATION=+
MQIHYICVEADAALATIEAYHASSIKETAVLLDEEFYESNEEPDCSGNDSDDSADDSIYDEKEMAASKSCAMVFGCFDSEDEEEDWKSSAEEESDDD